MSKICLTFLFILLILTSVDAQTVGGGLIFASPQGEFRSNLDRNGFGFQIQGTFWTPSVERPFTLGLDASYIIYGMKTETRPWYGFDETDLKITRTNSIASLHMLFQVSPFSGPVQPYIEGIFGGAYIFTLSEVKSDYNDESLSSKTNLDDFTWSYGAGGGVFVQLAQDLGSVSALFLDFKVRYMNGTQAEYLTENDIVVVSPRTGELLSKKIKNRFIDISDWGGSTLLIAVYLR